MEELAEEGRLGGEETTSITSDVSAVVSHFSGVAQGNTQSLLSSIVLL